MASKSRRIPSSSSQPALRSSSIARLQNIANHMSSTSTTSFPAEVVPQAPEDPLFGLMRAYKADESPNKVDLVSPSQPPAPLLCSSPACHWCCCSIGQHANSCDLRELAPTVTTTQNLGSCRWSRRCAALDSHSAVTPRVRTAPQAWGGWGGCSMLWAPPTKPIYLPAPPSPIFPSAPLIAPPLPLPRTAPAAGAQTNWYPRTLGRRDST